MYALLALSSRESYEMKKKIITEKNYTLFGIKNIRSKLIIALYLRVWHIINFFDHFNVSENLFIYPISNN